ncbi:16S rRNA (cytidine(1402)-2'-O)-methyltransferase [Acanthopleuribacter pedis]|uniref:Ribosomal RNA small subunit methyltransferase I n=1 Tax=Acanthopleuribacter pedis TaxID=442870 RepID=A0A8J7U440_9BACT|nr:16S rRNA (cytidine(1402)-2'-O)-methyltransferase [Acanthopleuribacter pedis]MBO1318988.1 16S rRNA (cytidine(1402)-2'-O)-methyltransferase [Acanthopleuribacter pedis]
MLILAATPIGNLQDASPRLGSVLADADLLFAEDTRQTRKLLQHFDLERPLRAFHEFSDERALEGIRRLLADGKKVVYVSDAGMPAVSDPGYELVRLALAESVDIDVIPGPSAVLNALVLSGLPSHEFCFLGFLPSTDEKRRRLAARLATLQMTAVFFEAPTRIHYSLAWLAETAPEVQVALCRELTKLHQQVLRGTPSEVDAALTVAKGEMVLVVGPFAEDTVQERSLEEQYQQLLEGGKSPSQAVRELAKAHRIQKRELYRRLQLDGGR